MLKREDWRVGKHVVYRLYREEGLCLRAKRPRRRKMAVHREACCLPLRPNEAWSIDFVHDQLSTGKKLRLLTVVDVITREALAIEVGEQLCGEDVARVLNRMIWLRGAPKTMFCDNGAEFTGQIIDLGAYAHKVKMDFSRPGTPTDNAHIESFNGSLRDEFLNVNWFASIAEARRLAEIWRCDYNESRPHMARNGKRRRNLPESRACAMVARSNPPLDFNAVGRPSEPGASAVPLHKVCMSAKEDS